MPKGTVPAVERAIDLLDEVANSNESLTLSRLTNQLQLPKSTVLGLCTTLTRAGLLTRRDNGTYELGVRTTDLARAYLARLDITKEFVQVSDSVPVLPEETVVLAVLDATDVVYVACRKGSRDLAISFRIGMRLPASCTASGKALLSSLPPSAIEVLYRSKRFPRLTKASICTLDAFLLELAKTRQRGFAIDDEETRDGMYCVGAPVFDFSGSEAIGAIAISLLKAEENPETRSKAAHEVLKFAQLLSTRLGAAPPRHDGLVPAVR